MGSSNNHLITLVSEKNSNQGEGFRCYYNFIECSQEGRIFGETISVKTKWNKKSTVV